MSEEILEAPAVLEKVEVVESGLHNAYDQLRLMGAVVGMKQLLTLALSAKNERDRVAASKELIKLGEKPEKIAERLRASSFADLTVKELEAILQTGIMDPEKALEAFTHTEESND